MQCNFPTFVRASAGVSFTASVDEITINTSENVLIRFPSFLNVNYLLTF